MADHKLSTNERQKLRIANRALTSLTISHAHFCDCELCEARAYTNHSREEFYVIPNVDFVTTLYEHSVGHKEQHAEDHPSRSVPAQEG